MAVRAFSQQDFWSENENDGVGEFWGKSSHYLMPDGMSTHDRGQNGAKIAPGGKILELRLCVWK